MVKTFRGDLEKLTEKIKNGEHFSYARFSDGELRILENLRVIIDSNRVCVGERDNRINWTITENEHKEFDPTKHNWVRNKLIDAFTYNDVGYYKGISCRCCLDGLFGPSAEEEFLWQVEESGLDANDERLTWSNLFLNGNYPYFLEHTVPVFSNYEIIMVCNKNYKYDPSRFPLKINKFFPVGKNCMVNDVGLIDEMKKYIDDNEIKNHLFLFSAGSLSNFLCHELWMHNKNNTYIDIGSTLNPFLGFPLDRRYLRGYWASTPDGLEDMKKMCIW